MLSDRYRDALSLAFDLHRDQSRKGSGVPYVAHLLGVSSMVLEYGADEDEAIAALLHDAVEDQGGAQTLGLIHERFGACVAGIVEECSDAAGEPKPAWRQRKERYLLHLRTASPSAKLVSSCDKLYNARAILSDLRRGGDAVWTRFAGGRDGTIWYYRALAEALAETPPGEELRRVVDEICEHAGGKREDPRG